jgi:peptidyl-prolyl cis-trans isomerase A (cyclophilin A)
MSTSAPTLAALACLVLCGCSQAPPPVKEAKKAAPERAPEAWRVSFETTRGAFVAEVRREWAPHGADHFYDLVKTGFYDGAPFYRVVRNFVAQFGIPADPSAARLWSQANIPDDPVKLSNTKGTLAYAMSGPGTRTTQVFVNLRDNSKALDKTGFAPFAKVASGMDVVESLYAYGELAPKGGGPDVKRIEAEGPGLSASQISTARYHQKSCNNPRFVTRVTML